MYKFSLLCLALTSCGLLGNSEKCDPGDKKVYNSAIISFELQDVLTSQNLLDLRGVYDPDTVKIYSANRERVFRGPVRPDGLIDFAPLRQELDQLPYATDLTRNYYLYLNRADQDTFFLAFRLRKNDCGFAEFERYTLKYNGKEVAAGEGLYLPSLILHKK